MQVSNFGSNQVQRVTLQLTLTLLIGFSCAAASATTYHIAQKDSNASDSNPGTEAQPWLTLKHATNNSTIVAGDTVIVKEGIYIDPTGSSSSISAFNPANSGSAGNPITFRSEPALAAIIDNGTDNAPSWGLRNRSHIVLDGFKVTGAIGATDGSNNTIQNCEVTVGAIIWGDSSLHWGVYLESETNSVLRNNYIHSLTTSLGSLNNHNSGNIMVFKGHGNIIENNTADGNNRYRKCFATKATPILNTTWRYNFAIHCSSGFQIIGGAGDAVTGWKLHNNIIVNSNNAFYIERNGEGHKIYNNTAYNTEQFIELEILNGENTTDIEVYNNLVSPSVNMIKYGAYGTQETWSALIAYFDHNAYTAGPWSGNFAEGLSGPPDYSTITSWSENELFSLNHSITDVLFVNPGGTTAADYKRASYPTDGRGGAHASVHGAYISGDEVVGYHGPSDDPVTLTPQPPQNLRVVQ